MFHAEIHCAVFALCIVIRGRVMAYSLWTEPRPGEGPRTNEFGSFSSHPCPEPEQDPRHIVRHCTGPNPGQCEYTMSRTISSSFFCVILKEDHTLKVHPVHLLYFRFKRDSFPG